MKKFSFLLAAGLIISSLGVSAQFYINPNPVYVDGIEANDFEGIGYAMLYNESNGNLNLTWQRNVLEITDGWETAVCDLTQCYLPQVGSQSFGIGAGQSGIMNVYVYPNDIEGAAIIEIEVFQSNDPSNTTTATYYFNQGTSGVAEKFSEAVKVYPNPTQDWITIDNADNTVVTADLYDVKGSLVVSSTVNGSQRLSIQELPAGNYILKMMDINGSIVSTNHLVKN